MRINLLTVLLVLSVIFGIKAAWTSQLQISARRQIVGPLARKLGWCMIAMPLFAAASIGVCVGVLQLLKFENQLVYGQGIIFGIVFVLLATAYTANAVRKYGVPIKATDKPLDWADVNVRSSAPDFGFLSQGEKNTTGETNIVTEQLREPEPPSGSN